MAANRNTAATPPAIPPAISLVCDIGDGVASEPAGGEGVYKTLMVTVDAVLGVDVGLDADVE